MHTKAREGVHIIDNVTVYLREPTGEERSFSCHNIALNYGIGVFSRWIAGVNNTGQNAVLPPTKIALGSGSGTPAPTDTGLFTAISGAVASLAYATPNSPSNGTTTFVFQIGAGIVTVQVTEAFLSDITNGGFAHTMFGTPFTPSSTETITIQWEFTFAT